jgi:hypothetical protein
MQRVSLTLGSPEGPAVFSPAMSYCAPAEAKAIARPFCRVPRSAALDGLLLAL